MPSLAESELYTADEIFNDTSLLCYYRFNSGALITDSSPNGITLTNNNSVGEFITGKFGYCADFGSANTTKYFSKTSMGSLPIGAAARSIHAWVKVTTDVIQQMICGWGYNSAAHACALGVLPNGHLYFTGYSMDMEGTIVINDNNWHCVDMTYDGTNMRLYIDGVLDGVLARALNTTTQNLYIASSCDPYAGGALSGMIDDFALFSKALSYDEVKILAGYSSSAQEFGKTAHFLQSQPKSIANTWIQNSTNLRGYWKFDDNGGTTVTDSGSLNHPGTASRAAINGGATGKFNFCGTFIDTSSDNVDVGTHSDFQFSSTESITIGLWMKSTSFTNADTLIARRNYTTNGWMNYQIMGRTTGSTPRLGFLYSTAMDTYHEFVTTETITNLSLADGNWHFIVFTYTFGTGSSAKFYVDGRNVPASWSVGNGNTVHTNNVGEKLVIGANWSGAYSEFFNGSLDDVFIMNASLVEQDIRSIYAHTALYYKFNETSGTTVTDSSGNAHDGTASAASIIADNNLGMFDNRGVFASASSNKVTITDHADLKPTGAFSIGCWIKYTNAADAIIFQSYSLNSNRAGIRLTLNATNLIQIESNKNTGTTTNVDWAIISTTTAFNDGSWHFVVGTGDGAALKIYVDGALNNSIAWAYSPVYAATNYVRVGCYNGNGTDQYFFNGSIDDLFLLNGTALSTEQIREIYEGRKLGELYPTNSLIGLWHLNGQSTDVIGNKTMTETNVAWGNGLFKKGLSCGGSTRIVSTTNMGVTGNPTFSISCWVKLTDTTADQCFWRIADAAPALGCCAIFWNMSGDSALQVQWGGSRYTYTSAITMTPGKWYNIVVVKTPGAINTTTKLYINGKLIGWAGGNSDTPNMVDEKMYIGAFGGSIFTKGVIDEVSVWTKALSEAEIKKTYMKSVGKLQ